MSSVPPFEKPRDAAWFALTLAGSWLLAFSVYFFSRDLPNNSSINRLDFWVLLPESFSSGFGLVAGPDLAGGPAQAGWKFVPQRFEYYALAAVVLGAAFCAGRLMTRPLHPERFLDRFERWLFAVGLGLAAFSLYTLGCGLLGWLEPAAFWTPLAAVVVADACWTVARGRRSRAANTPPAPRCGPTRAEGLALLAAAPFLLAILLGAPLPSIDFDVNEYHFLGPKEFLQAGRIRFLPHNVYTSFPFGTEMLTLLAMVLRQDWYWGALAGKCVLAAFGVLTAAALWCAGRRWLGAPAGALAALVWISTPWTYRISTTAYAEGGLSFYLVMALYACGIACERDPPTALPGATASKPAVAAFLCGLLAGAAMACKYPALVSVIIPLLVVLVVHPGAPHLPAPALANVVDDRPRRFWNRNRLVRGGLFLAGAAMTVGPWLCKNLVETGNPVYPLGFWLFGGTDWNAALDQKWRQAHSASTFSLSSLWAFLLDVVARNDWLSPLLFGLAPLALLRNEHRRRVAALWAYSLWLFISCWALTHRIDRFWVPMLPVVALLAGVGGSRLLSAVCASGQTAGARSLARSLLIAALVLVLCFNLAVCTSSLGGNNAFLLEMNQASKLAAALTAPEIVHLNAHLPQGAKVLAVGDAEMFEARFPVVYNTVFDKCIFEEWLARPAPASGLPRKFADPAAVRKTLAEQGITHLYVNWLEVLRYRSPGNYGFTPFVTPEGFDWLKRSGVLAAPWDIPDAWMPVNRLNESWRGELEAWGGRLLVERDGVAGFTTFQVFPVAASESAAP